MNNIKGFFLAFVCNCEFFTYNAFIAYIFLCTLLQKSSSCVLDVLNNKIRKNCTICKRNFNTLSGIVNYSYWINLKKKYF